MATRISPDSLLCSQERLIIIKTAINHKQRVCLLLGSSSWLGSGLLGSLGGLADLVNLGNSLDDTDGNGLTHVTDGEATEWWVLGESLNAHWLGWDELNHGGITRLDSLW